MRNQQLYLLLLLFSSSFSNAMSGSSSDPISKIVLFEDLPEDNLTFKMSVTSDGEIIEKQHKNGNLCSKKIVGNLNDKEFVDSLCFEDKTKIYNAISPEVIEKAANDYKEITKKNNENIVQARKNIAEINRIRRSCLLGLLPMPVMPLWCVVPGVVYIRHSLELHYLYRQPLKNIVPEEEQECYIETRRKDWDRLRYGIFMEKHLDTYNNSLEKRDLNLPNALQNRVRAFLNMPHHQIYGNPALSQPSEVRPT